MFISHKAQNSISKNSFWTEVHKKLSSKLIRTVFSQKTNFKNKIKYSKNKLKKSKTKFKTIGKNRKFYFQRKKILNKSKTNQKQI